MNLLAKDFLNLRQYKVDQAQHKAERDIERAQRAIDKANATMRYDQNFWGGIEGLVWYLQKNNRTTAHLRGSGDAELEAQLDTIDQYMSEDLSSKSVRTL